jgi:DNA-binding transcriptional ArsR family regulator
METLSNFGPPAKTQKAGEERRPQAEDALIITELRHPNRKLEAAEAAELVNAYLAGDHLNVLARRFGMHEQTVKAHLRRAGVQVRPWPRLSATEIIEASRLYGQGRRLSQLSERFDCNASTMRRALQQAGVRLRPRGRSRLGDSDQSR